MQQPALATVAQGFIGSGGPLWPLRRQEYEGMGTQHLQIHSLRAPGGLRHGEDAQPSSAAIC